MRKRLMTLATWLDQLDFVSAVLGFMAMWAAMAVVAGIFQWNVVRIAENLAVFVIMMGWLTERLMRRSQQK
ncbi:hypothetical protein [Nonomuraea sp. SYSU D8015]|uniref:hypothetical protein n=1 Tax=Nonomuraea sp. SYSU D8015 TaxID=2593644 RepID=UPI001660A1A8|nr:hypothetical protein [Nonomuraea sp. SYSU D8015]